MGAMLIIESINSTSGDTNVVFFFFKGPKPWRIYYRALMVTSAD